MVRPLRAGTSSASPQPVERPVNGCTQPFHRTAWTPLENRGRSVDTKGSYGLAPALAGSVRLVLLLGAAGVDRAVEVVFLKLAFDVLRGSRRIELVECQLVLLLLHGR